MRHHLVVMLQLAPKHISQCWLTLFWLHNKLIICCRFYFLFSAEIEKCEGDELRKDADMKKYLDIISNKNIKLSERVLIPIQQYPKVRDTPTMSTFFADQ